MECVVLCIKAPEAGKVLTGFQNMLQPQQCAELYKAYLEDTFEMTQELGIKRIFACSPGMNHPYFQDLAKRIYTEMMDYTGATPGARIGNALNQSFKKGVSKAVLWDAETPAFPTRLFKDVFSRLEKTDVALGPAMDYGTYLVAAKGKNPGIFESAKWDTPSEFSDLVKAAEAIKIQPHIHQVWPRLRRPEDLPFFVMNFKQNLKTIPRLGRNTQKALMALNLFT